MISQMITSTAILALLTSAAQSCGGDSDASSMPNYHSCADDIDEGSFASYSLQLLHEDPRTCPLWLNYAGELVNAYATIYDFSGDATTSYLDVYNYNNSILLADHQSSFFYDEFHDEYTAHVGDMFAASDEGHGWDYVEWGVAFDYGAISRAELQLYYASEDCPSGDCLMAFCYPNSMTVC